MNYTSDGEDDGDWLEERISDPYDGNAEDALQNEELGEAIQNCMSRLTPKQAKIFSMKTIEGYETEVICNELNITCLLYTSPSPRDRG